MAVKNMFEPVVKDELIDRINKLTPQTQPLWGKMNVSQMMAHVQVPIGVGMGKNKLQRSLMGKIFGPIAKKSFVSDKPFKRNLPTDRSFVMINSQKDFEKEKQSLIDMINHFNQENIVTEIHPFFGKLTKEQWSTGTWKHLDHHLQQFGV